MVDDEEVEVEVDEDRVVVSRVVAERVVRSAVGFAPEPLSDNVLSPVDLDPDVLSLVDFAPDVLSPVDFAPDVLSPVDFAPDGDVAARDASDGPDPTVDFFTGAFGADGFPSLGGIAPDDDELPLRGFEAPESGREEDADLSEELPAVPDFFGFPASPAFFGSLVRDLNLPELRNSASKTADCPRLWLEA